MGKKGKVETKRAKVAFRVARKKEAKAQRRMEWKLRRPQNHELRCVHEGVEEAIRAQGAERGCSSALPSPVTFFACVLSVLQGRPDPKKLPYFLALLDMQ
eukprot:gene8020-31373_t